MKNREEIAFNSSLTNDVEDTCRILLTAHRDEDGVTEGIVQKFTEIMKKIGKVNNVQVYALVAELVSVCSVEKMVADLHKPRYNTRWHMKPSVALEGLYGVKLTNTQEHIFDSALERIYRHSVICGTKLGLDRKHAVERHLGELEKNSDYKITSIVGMAPEKKT